MVNAQPISGGTVSALLACAAKHFRSKDLDALLAIAGDSLYGLYPQSAEEAAAVRDTRAKELADILCRARGNSWAELNRKQLQRELRRLQNMAAGGGTEDVAVPVAGAMDVDYGEVQAPPEPAIDPVKAAAEKLKLPSGYEALLNFDPLGAFITDTRSSDLMIASLARYMCDFIGLAIGAREAERTLGTVNVLTRHFRMVTFRS